MFIFLFYKIFLERFGQYFKKSKNGFPIVFSNLARKGSGVHFHARVLIFSPNALYKPTKQPWGYPKFGFCHHHLQLSPNISSQICRRQITEKREKGGEKQEKSRENSKKIARKQQKNTGILAEKWQKNSGKVTKEQLRISGKLVKKQRRSRGKVAEIQRKSRGKVAKKQRKN